MKCFYCGEDNEEGARFCKSCGKPLSDSERDITAPMAPVDSDAEIERMNRGGEAYAVEEDDKRSKKKIAIVIIVAVVVIIFAVFAFQGAQRARIRKSAVAALANEDYDKAYEEYKKLYEMTENESYREEANEAKKLAKDKESLEEANDALNDQALVEAFRRYATVKGHDNDLSSEADEGIARVVTAAESKVRAYNESQEFQKASELMSELLAVDPENGRLLALKEETVQDKDKADQVESAKKVGAAKREQKASEEQAQAANKAKRASEGSRILYTVQHVTTPSANVRSGPGKSYPVIYELEYGAEVYVIDTQSDSVRTWCNIGDGWISYRTLNGEL
ncbi:MAG: SH3 domain-containing protein [Peptoniphilus sp.]|nr:SH3 domain-containing protein [Peptoniphilus sp.]MDD7363152.1 SH3 domain-containing protein [Bacillota bacterium]MDY6044524.1 SH3 domain-containing protein [Peptoniphilus sp.]